MASPRCARASEERERDRLLELRNRRRLVALLVQRQREVELRRLIAGLEGAGAPVFRDRADPTAGAGSRREPWLK